FDGIGSSDGHLRSTADAISKSTGLPVLGSLPRDPFVEIPERHLGLVPRAEGGVSEAVLDHLADLVLQRFDLVAIRRIADSAPPPPPDLQNPQAEEQTPRARIGV